MIKENFGSLIYAIAITVGTIVGAGIFGLPYLAAHSGFVVVFIYFLAIGFLVYLINSVYGEIVLQTKGKHRLPGFVEFYLGKKWKHFAFAVTLVSLWGASLAYLVLGGTFLTGIFQPIFGGSKLVYSFIYFLLGAFFVFGGVKAVKKMELGMLGLMLAMVVGLFYYSFPWLKIDYLTVFSDKQLFLPYGVILFSLWGANVIPEIHELFKKDKNKLLQQTMIWSIIISVIIYALFVVSITGITGMRTTPDAVSGLTDVFSSKIIVLGYIFGILTTFTSYISLGLTMKKGLAFDYHVPSGLAGILACGIPFILFLLGLNNFLQIISVVGAIAMGLEGVLIFVIYLKLRKNLEQWYSFFKHLYFKIPNWGVYLLIGIFLVGVLLEISVSIEKIIN